MAKQTYVLSGTTKIKELTPKQAKELNAAREDGKQWEPQEAAKKSKTATGSTAGKVKDYRKPKGDWNGHTMCEILRHCGKTKLTADQATRVVKGLGFKDPMRSTVHMQLGYGRRGYLNLPKLSGGEKAEIAKIAEGGTDKKSAKKSKAKVAAGADDDE